MPLAALVQWDKSMESGLLRQRRNLISISSILIVYDFADIKIEQVGWMGNSIEVGNPAALSLIIWIVWLYFLLRYYQYWSSEKDAKVLDDLGQLVQVRVFEYCEAKYQFPRNRLWNEGAILKRTRVFKWVCEVNEYDPVNEEVIIMDRFPIPIRLLMWWSAIQFFSYCFHKKHMSDHVLPFALAICALVIKAHSLI